MREIDKAGLGGRIRQIRREAGLRQWELARRLGTTQSAVHKYERGVIPEPKRLLEVARLGNTSIEWVLTGAHGDDGSRERERPSPELLRIARKLRELDSAALPSIAEALRILREAAAAAERHRAADTAPRRDEHSVRNGRRESSVLRVLEAAREIQGAVLARLCLDAEARLDASPLLAVPARELEPDPATPEGKGRRPAE